MKAVDSAPSASSRWNRFGILKATKKASVTGPAPKARATTTSRTNPRIRLVSVARPMLPTGRTTPASTAAAAPPFSPGSGSVTPPHPVRRGENRADQGPREEAAGGVRGCTVRTADDRERRDAKVIGTALADATRTDARH